MTSSHYINTDLEIESVEDFSPIVESFADDVVVLYHGTVLQKFRVSFESVDVAANANVTVNNFCKLIEALPISARKIWDRSLTKIFDIGYQAGVEPRSYSSEIQPDTIERLAALSAGIRVTIYSVQP